MTPALELDRLLVPFGAAPGLAPVTLAVAAGERVAIVGASGAGKTSLLRAIAGLGPAAGGAVRIGGRDVTAAPAERRGAVYLHQTPLLFPHLTVLENVAFPLRIRGVGRVERRARALDALAAVRLAELAGRRPDTLSGGQRHRAALARAVAARPPVLLLDEPLAALDPALRAEVRSAILATQREYGPALVLVTHDLDEAALVADRIGVLIGRELAQLAAPATLLTFPDSLAVARFLGGFAELPGRLLADGFETPLGVLRPARIAAGRGPRVAVVRIDAIRFGHGVPARVAEVRPLAAGVRIVLEIGSVRIEAAAPLAGAPRPGATVPVSVDERYVSLLPLEAAVPG